MHNIEATASHPRPSHCLPDVAGATDVDITVTIDGTEHEGEVTLIPAEDRNACGRLVAWGSPDHWVDGKLLSVLKELDGRTFTEALKAIESAASTAV